MKNLLTEKQFEDNLIHELHTLDWDTSYNFKRINKKEVIDFELLKNKLISINKINDKLATKAILEIKKITGAAIEQNIIGFDFISNGIKIYDNERKRTITIKLISDKLDENYFGIIRQFKVMNTEGESRFPDVVCFINGLPIIICELKAPNAQEGIQEAFQQNESLKWHSPQLFAFHIFSFISNNLNSKYGSLTSTFKRYFNLGKWSSTCNPLKKIFNLEVIMKFINIFSFYDDKKEVKYIAAQHQIEAVQNTIKKMKYGDHKGGVVWHTQGSGKSVTMLMLTKAIIQNFNYATTLIITDRNSLNKQLLSRFNNAQGYLLSSPQEIQSRNDLINKLNDKKHFGIFFTTVQKFSGDTGELSKRDDIFILIDEAHRTQNNIEGTRILDTKSQEFIVKFGFAKFMRNAFPNAILTGFTGTPLMGDKATTEVFGGYNHKYSMQDSIRDESTVPIFYESRRLELKLNEDYVEMMDNIQQNYAKTLVDNDIQSEQKMNTLLKSIQIKKILEDPKVITAKTKDILLHLSKRGKVLHGKAMIVASSRKAALIYYREILKHEPKREEETILVMTINNKDPKEYHDCVVPEHDLEGVASEFRKANSKYKIAIVVDKWLTGFDVPDLDVLYIDKIIKWHNLMQAIARVNRVFEDGNVSKNSGLIVDYLGIWKYLSDALIQYAGRHADEVDIIPNDLKKAKIKLIDEIDIVNEKFIKNIHHFPLLNQKEQYHFIMDSLENILAMNQDEKNKFILKARGISRLIKISFTIINNDLSTIAKCISLINSLMSTHNTRDDEDLKITIENINDAIEKSIDVDVSEIRIKSTNISKDINKVTSLLEDEAKQLISNNPNVAKKLLVDAINGKIAIVKKFRPIFAKKISDKLRDILSKLERDEKLQRVIEMLLNLSKEITDKLEETPEFNDPHLQAFFTILSDDEFLQTHQNSEVLRAIAKDLMSVVKENITDQFYKNSKVKLKIQFSLMKILKDKYNYPPKGAKGISGILIDRISKIISFNSNYFVNKKEII
ncbi:hypothetical protein C4B25_00385 [Mycoplasma todarodis]|uniref:Type I restriction enzyme endonuclease subunit n=2 Tax=Mycoplasma todarodis TaxID=1937191 RepID=A0A4R0XTV1_9MOLU|nr:hypothetical protein C4B25_00385 [Mycoplasma todarodis]